VGDCNTIFVRCLEYGCCFFLFIIIWSSSHHLIIIIISLLPLLLTHRHLASPPHPLHSSPSPPQEQKMSFTTLTHTLQSLFSPSNPKNEDIEYILRELCRALMEADVNVRLVQGVRERIREKYNTSENRIKGKKSVKRVKRKNTHTQRYYCNRRSLKK